MEIKKLDNIPKNLLNIKKPPKELYFQGNLELLKKPKIAIVGARKASQYSRNFTLSLSSRLSKAGFVVVSGGALGIDILAHEGSFPNTIGIMANSLDYIYPKTNEKLIKKMAEESLLLSEYFKGITAHPKRFIHRNRLIITLADIVVVVEADLNSGSSQSIRIALENNKPLFVPPHRVGESLATNILLENGQAKGIFDIDNFIENMKILFETEIAPTQNNNYDEVDAVLLFCQSAPSYEEAFQKFGDKLFEYELEGKIEVKNGTVIVI